MSVFERFPKPWTVERNARMGAELWTAANDKPVPIAFPASALSGSEKAEARAYIAELVGAGAQTLRI